MSARDQTEDPISTLGTGSLPINIAKVSTMQEPHLSPIWRSPSFANPIMHKEGRSGEK